MRVVDLAFELDQLGRLEFFTDAELACCAIL